MWRTNLKILATVVITIGVYTGISNIIPQVESEVPERVEISSDVSTQELVSMGEEIYRGAGGCEACHGAGTRAPRLLGEIGTRCGERVPEQGCKAYLHESLTEPRAFLVEGFQPIMPSMAARLSDGQIWALVAFLQSQGGEITVTPQDLQGSGGTGGTGGDGGGASQAAGGDGGGGASVPGEVMTLLRDYQCITCHQAGGEGGMAAPPVAAIRDQGLPPDYIRRSIVRPNADTASGYEQDWAPFAGTMPANFGDRLSEEELSTLVEYMAGEGS